MAYKHCAEARRLVDGLHAELAERGLVLGAAEALVVEQVCDCLDRKSDLQRLYDAAEDVTALVKLSAEIRLLESTAGRLLRQVSTDDPSRESPTTKRARKAADARWGRGA